MRSLLVAVSLCFALSPLTACLDAEAPSSDEAETEAVVPAASLEIPEELRLYAAGPAPTTLAHTNCGHMQYCASGGRAVYCYYSRASTGCSLQNIQDDFNSDCQYVCGHTACLNATIRACN